MKSKSIIAIVLMVLGVMVLATWQGADAARGRRPALSKEATAAIEKAFPQAKIVQVEPERKGVVVYEVELIRDGEEVEVLVTSDGQIVAVESEIGKDDLPAAVAAAVAKHVGDAEIKEIEKEEIRATLQFVALETPQIVYEVEFLHEGREVELKIDGDGKILSREVEDEEDDAD